MTRLLLASTLAALLLSTPAHAQTEDGSMNDQHPRLVVRIDDIGFCHAANEAGRRAIEAGGVTSVSVIVNTPWLDEAVDMLKQHPDIAVGVHLCLNSEWREFRWGPVAPVAEVPTLVDEHGKFFGTRAQLFDNQPATDQIERELRAQIDLALAKGLNISYVDYHMGAAMTTPESQQVVEKLAKEYGLGISQYFGEVYLPTVFSTPPEDKTTQGVKILESLDGPGLFLFVAHPGLDVPEMQAMTDLNATGTPNMSIHRQAETDLLTSQAWRDALERMNIQLISYADLRNQGLENMSRPWLAEPYKGPASIRAKYESQKNEREDDN